MKRLWISLMLIVAVVAATFAGSYHFKSINRQVRGLVTSAEVAALNARWEDARQLTDAAYDLWHDHSFFLYATMRHLDTDSVYTALDQAGGCAIIEDEHGFVTSTRSVTSKLWLMEESESLSLENIL